ncbi:MAG: ABC transporter ATP-binding protein [Bellilinea sp.]
MRYLVLRTENLTKNYGRSKALVNISLEVEPGEVYGILGPKGAGKSTLLNIFMNNVRPTSGIAMVMGMDSVRHSHQLRQLVGFLPEHLPFPENLTGEQIINRLASLHGPVDFGYVRGLADRFGLDISRRISDLSRAGQKSLGIVRAFMRRPELVLLDSPSINLDLERQNQLYKLIADTRTTGATVVVASQSLVEMERISDRVAVLHQGNLLAVERGVVLRSRALRKIEMRFAEPICGEAFAGLTNIHDLALDDNKLRCTLQGEPDALFKKASQFRLLDVISQQPTLDEVYHNFYGIPIQR